MVNVHVDPHFDDEERRRRIYRGDVIVYSRVPEVADFARFARELVGDVLAPYPPQTVHTHMKPGDLATLLIDFKPSFIHHPDSMSHVRRIVTGLGGDDQAIHADLPKLRTAFPEGGLNTGIAYAFQPHRDTWYAAPPQQVNWWMPIWPASQDNVMEFYPRWFGAATDNTSDQYSYYQANEWRGRIKDFSGGKDTRVHPAPRTPMNDAEPRLCLIPPVGGIMLFSGDQLHATIPNTTPLTRYSIDFRTVHIDDVRAGKGAPCVDVRCVGTSMRDFRRLRDLSSMAERDVAPYDTEGAEGLRVFVPQ